MVLELLNHNKNTLMVSNPRSRDQIMNAEKRHGRFAMMKLQLFYLNEYALALFQKYCIQDMYAINDPPGQAHLPDSSDHYSILKIICFARFCKMQHATVGRPCGSIYPYPALSKYVLHMFFSILRVSYVATFSLLNCYNNNLIILFSNV